MVADVILLTRASTDVKKQNYEFQDSRFIHYSRSMKHNNNRGMNESILKNLFFPSLLFFFAPNHQMKAMAMGNRATFAAAVVVVSFIGVVAATAASAGVDYNSNTITVSASTNADASSIETTASTATISIPMDVPLLVEPAERSLAGPGGNDTVEIDYTIFSMAVLTMGLLLVVEIIRYMIDILAEGNAFFETVLRTVYHECMYLNLHLF